MLQKKEKECDELLSSCDKLRAEIAVLDEKMADPTIYSNPDKITKIVKEKEEKEALLNQKEEMWFMLSEEVESLKENL